MGDNPLIVAPAEKVVLIYPGDIALQLETLKDEMLAYEADAIKARDDRSQARAALPKRMGIKVPTPEEDAEADAILYVNADAKAEEYDAAMASARDRAVSVRLQGIGHAAFERLKEEHPPREGNSDDRAVGFHPEPFNRAFVLASMVEPKVTAEQFEEFVNSPGLTDAKWIELCNAAWALSAQDVNLPKFSAVSLLRQARGLDSPPQPDTESVPDDSTAGSRKKSTSTTTPKAN